MITYIIHFLSLMRLLFMTKQDVSSAEVWLIHISKRNIRVRGNLEDLGETLEWEYFSGTLWGHPTCSGCIFCARWIKNLPEEYDLLVGILLLSNKSFAFLPISYW